MMPATATTTSRRGDRARRVEGSGASASKLVGLLVAGRWWTTPDVFPAGPWDARDRDYLVITLTPTGPGRVRLVEVSLRYRTDRSLLHRRGTDTIGLDVRVPTTGERG